DNRWQANGDEKLNGDANVAKKDSKRKFARRASIRGDAPDALKLTQREPGRTALALAEEIFSMAYETLLYEVADEIATITLNRPAKMNAYTAEMGREMAEAMLQADRDRSARVVIMTGAGDRAFCAGADMSMFASNIRTRETHGSVDEGRGGGISL